MAALILEAYLEAEDARLLPEVLACTDARAVGTLAPAWIADDRKQVRRMLLEYIDDGCTRPNHQPLIKRLYKLAEAQSQDDVLAHFAVVFDRFARRHLEKRYRWDPTTGGETDEILTPIPTIPRGTAPTARTPPVAGRAPPPRPRVHVNGWTGETVTRPQHHLPTFTFRTRRYLQRRAWRRYRTLAKTEPARYVSSITNALALYEDEHLSTPFMLLDAWTLVHALYHHSPILEQTTHGWNVREGQDLGELAPAPYAEAAWTVAAGPLFELVSNANSRTVRTFAISMLEKHHASALEGVVFERVRALLRSRHEEVQIFGAQLLEKAQGLEVLPIDQWLALLEIDNPMVAPLVVRLVKKHVKASRVSDDECAALAKSRVAPVAELGFEWLRQRAVTTPEQIERALELTKCPAPSVREHAMPWLVERLEEAEATTPEHVRELIDARYEDVREAGTNFVFGHEAYESEPKLWGAMSETPYADVRAALVTQLDRVNAAPLEADEMQRVWASVLTAIDRGSRAKAKSTRQLAERIAREPTTAEALLPLLAIALRSSSETERKAALTALARAAFSNPALRAAIEAHFGDLKLWPEVPV